MLLKANPFAASAARNFGIEDGPIPCNFKISVSVYFESTNNVVIPSRSSALLAGAPIKERKPSSGFSSSAHTGHTGQLLLL